MVSPFFRGGFTVSVLQPYPVVYPTLAVAILPAVLYILPLIVEPLGSPGGGIVGDHSEN